MDRSLAPEIHVGIMESERICFALEGSFSLQDGTAIAPGAAEARCGKDGIEVLRDGRILLKGRELILMPGIDPCDRFRIRDVVIGIGFHWEQKEDQVFPGVLKLMAAGGKVQLVNIVPIEQYLGCVISSEMRADCPPALLRAHAILSRSWLLAQVEKQRSPAVHPPAREPFFSTGEEWIRWYDREDHLLFHVCADDHCQRYQGVGRTGNPDVARAVSDTAGRLLVYQGTICDARYSKCCGGVTEEYQHCWEPLVHPYLRRTDDRPQKASPVASAADLKVEAHAIRFISGNPDAFCNTVDPELLGRVLNNYDLFAHGIYRWEEVLSQEEVSRLVRERSGTDFGEILDLVPVERGESGRLVKLRICGTKRTLTIGKELEIRRWLSRSHLYSSAFIVHKGARVKGIPRYFTLRGAGWGHGVGLCQIGAAVMAGMGYTHQEILEHYFRGASIVKQYG
jgi:SpoIID/LytB domain protein